MSQDSIRESDYEGWVAWVDGEPAYVGDKLVGFKNATPLFESIPHNPRLIQVASGLPDRAPRLPTRQVIDWKQLPHERVVMLELYAFRDVYSRQPVIQIQRQPGRDLRWIQYKKSGLIAHAGHRDRRREIEGGQARTGITMWMIGYWDRTVGQCQIFGVPARGGEWDRLEFDGSNHPCWPRPLGFGLSPVVLGLSGEDVPPVPASFAGVT